MSWKYFLHKVHALVPLPNLRLSKDSERGDARLMKVWNSVWLTTDSRSKGRAKAGSCLVSGIRPLQYFTQRLRTLDWILEHITGSVAIIKMLDKINQELINSMRCNDTIKKLLLLKVRTIDEQKMIYKIALHGLIKWAGSGTVKTR